MTKKYVALSIAIVLAIIAFFFLNKKEQSVPSKSSPLSTHSPEQSGPRDLPQDSEISVENHSKAPDRTYPVWESNLRKNILAQAGEHPPEITITKIKSFVIQRDGASLNVDSVLVNLKVDKKDKTTFKALVDSQTGKILQTWDQPVYDPIEHKDNFSIKIDPRYPQ